MSLEPSLQRNSGYSEAQVLAAPVLALSFCVGGWEDFAGCPVPGLFAWSVLYEVMLLDLPPPQPGEGLWSLGKNSSFQGRL